MDDLTELRKIAEDRKQWKLLVETINLNYSFNNNPILFNFLVLTVVRQYIQYLQNRSFNVKCPKTESAPNVYSTVVPKGCVLRPLLFTLYTVDLKKIGKDCSFLQFEDSSICRRHSIIWALTNYLK